MKIVTFQAGLGNQIFQYCYYLYLKRKFPYEKFFGYYPSRCLKAHNGLEISKWFEVELPKSTIWSDIVANLLFWSSKLFFRINLRAPLTDNDWFRYPNAILYYGFWQNKKYVQSIDLPIFKKDLHLDEINKSCLNRIKQTTSVAVHVRRGDYTNPKIQHIYGNIGTLDFYHRALDIIKAKFEKPHFFFFSDDPDYVNDNFHEDNMEIINWNKGDKSFFDLYLMSHCKNMIIPNSTFSCWAAYLNKQNPIVICPKKWRNDKPTPPVILESWIRI